MFCAACGHRLPVEPARFCPSCGQPAAPGAAPARRGGRTAAAVLTVCAVLGAAGIGVAVAQRDDGAAALSGGSQTAAQAPTAPALTATATPSPTSTPLAAGPAALADRHGAAVLRVEATGCDLDGSGTGFAIDPWHVVTNHHVVSVDPTPELVGRDGSLRQGRVIGWRESPDLAVIEVDEPLPLSLEWADTSSLTEGQSLVALGYPVPELDFAVTQADIVSFKVRDGVRQAVRTDGNVDRGGSGGPALTADGRVAGVVTEMDPNEQGLQLVALLYTADALVGDVRDILSSPQDVTADCDASAEELPEDWDEAGAAPYAYGDDPTLDELQDGCEAGDMAACDALYRDSPVGSEYETYGATCGQRDEYLAGTCDSPPDDEQPPAAPAPEPEPHPEPEVVEPAPAEDPLAGLRAACLDGDAEACDRLWHESPAGSADEQVAATCGGRLGPESGTCVARGGGS